MFMYVSSSIIGKIGYFICNILFNVFIKTQYFIMRCLDLNVSNWSYYLSNDQIINLEFLYNRYFVEDRSFLGFTKSLLRFIFYTFILVFSLFLFYKFWDLIHYILFCNVSYSYDLCNFPQNKANCYFYELTWDFYVNDTKHYQYSILCKEKYFKYQKFGLYEVMEDLKKIKEYQRQCNSYNLEVSEKKKNLFFCSFIYLSLLYLFIIDIN